MAIPGNILQDNPELLDWCILLCYRGSIAHGTYVSSKSPNSIDDKDAMGICVPPIDHYIGLRQYGSRGTKEIKRDEWDIVIYEARKAIDLLAKGNPNMLFSLWLEPQYYLNITPAGQLLLDNRHLFVGKHVYKSFVGYAYGQLKRMTHFKFEGYMGSKRKALVDKYGHDCKNASHLIRILRMGIEFLTDGVMYVKRHDAPQLLEIKNGEWTLEQVKAEADRLFASIENSYICSPLPLKPDMEAINRLCIDVIRTHFHLRRETWQL